MERCGEGSSRVEAHPTTSPVCCDDANLCNLRTEQPEEELGDGVGTIDADDDAGDWEVVPKRKARTSESKVSHKVSHASTLCDLEQIRNSFLSVFSQHKTRPLQILLYGSLARCEARPGSDADVLVCFNRGQVPSHGSLFRIAQSLAAAVGRDVDLVVMEKSRKAVKHKESDIEFIENVRTDGVPLIRSSTIGKELLDTSVKLGLVKCKLAFACALA